ALPVAELGVPEAVERVGERPLVPGEHLDAVDRERRFAAPGLRRPPLGADDVPEVEVREFDAPRLAEKLEAPRAVDEIEERQLSVLAPAHDSTGNAPRIVGLGAGLERFCLGTNLRDAESVGKSLRRSVLDGR